MGIKFLSVLKEKLVKRSARKRLSQYLEINNTWWLGLTVEKKISFLLSYFKPVTEDTCDRQWSEFLLFTTEKFREKHNI